MYLVRSASARS